MMDEGKGEEGMLDEGKEGGGGIMGAGGRRGGFLGPIDIHTPIAWISHNEKRHFA